MKRRSCLVLLAAIVCGCSGGDQPAGPKTGELKIAVIPKGTTHKFWQSVHYGAEQAAKELGGVEILWKGAMEESDRAGQIAVVEDFINKQVDGVCLAPLDSQSLISVVRDAKSEGIPTVIFDSGLDDDQIVSYVATDNYNGGVLGARRLAEVMGGKGNVIIMRYSPGSESTEQREKGFLETIEKEFPDIKILVSNQHAGTTVQSATTNCQQVLGNHKDEVNGVFTVCEPNNTGMLNALEAEGLAGKVKFVGFDTSSRFIEAMKEGKMHGIVLQDPVRMGELAVKTMVAHLRGEKVETRVVTGEHVATPENMDTPEMQRLLAPPTEAN